MRGRAKNITKINNNTKKDPSLRLPLEKGPFIFHIQHSKFQILHFRIINTISIIAISTSV